MSERASTGRPSACSGDMYSAVPRIVPATVGTDVIVASVDGRSTSFAMPKSSTFARPSPVMTMFAGLMSRWMIPRPCAAASALAICAA